MNHLKICFTSVSLLFSLALGAQNTELFFAFDLEEDSTMSDSCLWSKRYFDSEGRKYHQEWIEACSDSTHWVKWKYRKGKLVSRQVGNDTASVSYRPVYRKFGIYQWVAMDTVSLWPFRMIYSYEDGQLEKEEWLAEDQTPFEKQPRIDHFKRSDTQRQETYLDTENKPFEIRDYLYHEDGSLKEIHFRKLGDKRPYQIVRVYKN